MLKEYKKILAEKEWENLISQFNLNCFRYEDSELNFYYYIFTCDFKDERELSEHYSLINEHIALDFQTSLKKDVERWNIYIFYFVKTCVASNIKYSIEQDKYSTRKNVIEYNTNLDYSNPKNKMQVIDGKLFNLKRFPIEFQGEITINDIINEKDKDLNKFLQQFNNHRKKSRKESKDFLDENLKNYLGVK